MINTRDDAAKLLALVRSFYDRSDQLLGKIDPDILNALVIKYIRDVVKNGVSMDVAIEDLTQEAYRQQAERQHVDPVKQRSINAAKEMFKN